MSSLLDVLNITEKKITNMKHEHVQIWVEKKTRTIECKIYVIFGLLLIGFELRIQSNIWIKVEDL